MGIRHAKTAAAAGAACISLAAAAPAQAARAKWVDSWTASPQAAYPHGYEVGQPGTPGELGPGNRGPLLTQAFPDAQARSQTLRMIVHPSVGGSVWRLRLSNLFGTRAVTFGRVRVAVQASAGTIVPGTSRTLRFSGRRSLTIPAGKGARSDRFRLRLATRNTRNLAISLYVVGQSGPLTWHAASFMTSYLSNQGAGDHTADRSDAALPHSTTSWFFVSGLEVRRSSTASVIAFGDSITDGFFSSINGEDRWPDALQRRLFARERGGRRLLAVSTEAIAGNMVTRIGRLPGGCTACDGPPALDRLDRDLLSQPNVRVAILLEGINDLGGGGATAAQVIAGMKQLVTRVHARGIKIIGATLTPAAGTPFGLYGTPATDAARRQINDFIRNSGTFDGVADFSAATEDPANPGHLRPEFDLNSSVGGPADNLHPNRAGFLAMARAVNLRQLERLAR
jgi:lysophospholipase L1-like esterase